MKPKQIVKIVIDILMTAVLLLLMAYSLVGEVIHEWLGIGMFVLFILHHVLNSKWTRSLFKGKYTPFRILQTVLVVLALASMLGSMISGVVLSHHALSLLPITGGQSWARTLHMLSAYWGFAFLSLHLGLHWNMMIGMTKRMWKKPPVIRAWIVRAVGLLLAVYGVYAFIKREIGSYMLLKIQFVFFDYEEPLILFLLDYIAVMALFVVVGHYLTGAVRLFRKK
ncbi:MAG: DUF4405 domain-containing protein [Acetatifactor sp.]|nr:DUF4405 domain-containing protein [Acetatifactor sp.]